MFLILNSTDQGDISKLRAFLLSLIPSFIMGTGSAIGESTVLGYLRNFPKDFVSGWSSGTGMAGVIGASITIILHYMGVKPKQMYLYLSLLCFVYFLSFLFIEMLYKKFTDESRLELIDNDIVDKLEINQQMNDVKLNKNLNCTNFKRAFSSGYRYILNLFAVYYFEYTILAGFSDRVSNKGYITDIPKEYQYEWFNLSYQIGVFISRSSLFIVKNIEFVEIFSIIQLVSFIIWFTNVYFGFISISSLALINFVIIGLMGGSAYVACFYFILNSYKIECEVKELCVNIASIFNDTGILLSSVTILIFNATIMKN